MTDQEGRRSELLANLTEVDQRITAACQAAGRPRDAVTLVVVTKTWPVEDALLLRDLGVTDLAENRDSEARGKAAAVPGVVWHFVGSVQTNKARSVAIYADVVHSVDRVSLVDALSAGAVRAERSIDVLLQVSLDGDVARGGAAPGVLAQIADRVAAARGLELRGLMAVAPLGADPVVAFAALQQLSANLVATHPDASLLSAGMSGDLEAAIAAGATHVRVGTAVLGHRPVTLR